MVATGTDLFDLTAGDLQHPVQVFFREGMPLRDAAKDLTRAGVHGAPVVDDAGRCVGVLSLSDLARWAVKLTGPTIEHARTCYYQDTHRGMGGHETVVCTLPEGKCPFQKEKKLPDGRVVLECQEPHAVLLDWQMVNTDSLPQDDVRHYMTAEPVTAHSTATITEVARLMINSVVHRVIIVDDERRPTGIVSNTDLVAAIAGAHRG